jgi:hypothetical protein
LRKYDPHHRFRHFNRVQFSHPSPWRLPKRTSGYSRNARGGDTLLLYVKREPGTFDPAVRVPCV